MFAFLRKLFGLPPKNDYRLTSHFGNTSYQEELRDTREVAEGKTVKTFADGTADYAVLEELVNGKWTEVFRSPQPGGINKAQWADARS